MEFQLEWKNPAEKSSGLDALSAWIENAAFFISSAPGNSICFSLSASSTQIYI